MRLKHKLMAHVIKIVTLLLFATLLSCSTEQTAQTKVFKPDNSVQCGGAGIDVDVMAMELIDDGIDVLCAQTGNDGLLRIAVCGAGTGNINIYTINTANLPDAELLGFASVDTLPEYQDTRCDPV
jgi:hypothetical protein